MRRKVKNMMTLLAERRNKLQATENMADKKGQVIFT